MGRWNSQAIQTDMEKKDKIKNEREVFFGQQNRKNHTTRPIKE